MDHERRSPVATSEVAIEREVRIDAPRDVVFGFLTDPGLLPEWIGVHARTDLRRGGDFELTVYSRGVIVRGSYVEIDPPSRLVFTWGWDAIPNFIPPGSSTVEFTLEPEGEGTLLRLRHLGLPPEQAVFHGAGWDHYLPRLVEVAGGAAPQVDPWETGDAPLPPFPSSATA